MNFEDYKPVISLLSELIGKEVKLKPEYDQNYRKDWLNGEIQVDNMKFHISLSETYYSYIEKFYLFYYIRMENLGNKKESMYIILDHGFNNVMTVNDGVNAMVEHIKQNWSRIYDRVKNWTPSK